MKIINAFISKEGREQKRSFKCENFQTVEAHHNNCKEKLQGKCKCLKYYSDQPLMAIKLKFTVAVQKIIITVV